LRSTRVVESAWWVQRFAVNYNMKDRFRNLCFDFNVRP